MMDKKSDFIEALKGAATPENMATLGGAALGGVGGFALGGKDKRMKAFLALLGALGGGAAGRLGAGYVKEQGAKTDALQAALAKAQAEKDPGVLSKGMDLAGGGLKWGAKGVGKLWDAGGRLVDALPGGVTDQELAHTAKMNDLQRAHTKALAAKDEATASAIQAQAEEADKRFQAQKKLTGDASFRANATQAQADVDSSRSGARIADLNKQNRALKSQLGEANEVLGFNLKQFNDLNTKIKAATTADEVERALPEALTALKRAQEAAAKDPTAKSLLDMTEKSVKELFAKAGMTQNPLDYTSQFATPVAAKAQPKKLSREQEDALNAQGFGTGFSKDLGR